MNGTVDYFKFKELHKTACHESAEDDYTATDTLASEYQHFALTACIEHGLAAVTDSIAMRMAVERTIVMQAVTDLEAAGFVVMVDYGDYQEEPATVKNIMACDEEILRVYKDGKGFGYALLVYGNDGYDVIADYTVNLEEYLAKGAGRISDMIQEVSL